MRTRTRLRMAAPGAAAAFLVATVAAMPVAVALLPATLLQAPLAPAPGGGPAAATNGPGAARPGAGDARSLLPPRGGSRWPADPAAIAALLADARVVLSPEARADLVAEAVDGRIVAVLAFLARAHTLAVGVLRT